MAATVQIGQPAFLPTLNAGVPIAGMNQYTDQDMRRVSFDIAGNSSGITNPGDFLVTQTATASLQVQVGVGRYRIAGTITSTEGLYIGGSDSTVTLDCPAADAAKDRIDAVAIQIVPGSGATAGVANLTVLTGTLPVSGSPVAPTPGTDSFIVATMYRTAATTTVTNANITNISQYACLQPATKSGIGPPTAGAYTTSDMIFDSIGCAWICTVGGTPGTWVMASGRAVIASGTWTNATTPVTIGPATLPTCFNKIVIKGSGLGSNAGAICDASIQVNGNTGTIYGTQSLWVSGSGTATGAAASTFVSSANSVQLNNTGVNATSFEVEFCNYNATDRSSQIYGRSFHLSAAGSATGPMYRVTFLNMVVPITSIQFGWASAASGSWTMYGEI